MPDVESIMELVCDCCHWPYVCSEDELEERCAKCEIEKKLRESPVYGNFGQYNS